MFRSILEVVDIVLLIGVRSLKTCITQSYILAYLCDQCALFVPRFIRFFGCTYTLIVYLVFLLRVVRAFTIGNPIGSRECMCRGDDHLA